MTKPSKKRVIPHIQPMCPKCRGICKYYEQYVVNPKTSMEERLRNKLDKWAGLYSEEEWFNKIEAFIKAEKRRTKKANDKKWKTKLKTIESEVVKESQDYQTDEEGKKHYYVSIDLFKQKLQLLHDQTK